MLIKTPICVQYQTKLYIHKIRLSVTIASLKSLEGGGGGEGWRGSVELFL